MAERNGLPGDMKIKGLLGVAPDLTNSAEFSPGTPKSWALIFMINEEDALTGRPAGTLGWSCQSLLLDRSGQRCQQLPGDTDLPLCRPGLGWRLPGFRENRP